MHNCLHNKLFIKMYMNIKTIISKEHLMPLMRLRTQRVFSNYLLASVYCENMFKIVIARNIVCITNSMVYRNTYGDSILMTFISRVESILRNHGLTLLYVTAHCVISIIISCSISTFLNFKVAIRYK